MLASEAILKIILAHGVDTIFGYPGAANTPLFDLMEQVGIAYRLTRNEQGAAHAAAAYSKLTGKVGVCLATSGPGATNLITGIANAYMDSTPLLAITGQVVSPQVGKDAFQEVDMTGVTSPISKHNYLVKDARELPRIMNEAFFIAKTGRPGPVVVDIPMDVQKIEIEEPLEVEPAIRGYRSAIQATEKAVNTLAEAIKKARKPLMVVGGGVLNAAAANEFAAFIDATGLPAISTMMGIGALSCKHPRYYGMMGSHGVKPANGAFSLADLVVFLGARVSDRAVPNPAGLEKRAKIAHVDVDPAEIGKNVRCDIPVIGDVKGVLLGLTERLKGHECNPEWIKELNFFRDSVEDYDTSGTQAVNPKYFMRRLSDLTEGKAVVATEVGNNQIWAANHYQFTRPYTWLTSGGFGTMGYGLPAAFGAALAAPEETVVAVEGDGSFQMSMPELGAIKQWGANVKIVLFVNRMLGMVHEYQMVNYKSHFVSVELGEYPFYDKIAAAYDIPHAVVRSNADIDDAIQKMLADKGTYLLEVVVDPNERTL